jgi:predicted Zn-dependent protease
MRFSHNTSVFVQQRSQWAFQGISKAAVNAALFFSCCCITLAQQAQQQTQQQTQAVRSPLLDAMKAENERTMRLLAKEQNPPYFLSYMISDVQAVTITSSFGKLQYEDSSHTRTLDVEVRVGSYDMDNKRQIRGASFEMGGFTRGQAIPLDDDPASVRAVLWAATDRQYKHAAERYLKVVTNRAVKVKEEDASADFSRETPSVYAEPVRVLNVDMQAWRARLNRLSALFASDPKLYDGEVFLRAEIVTKYYVTSEGAEIQTSEPYVRVFAQARTKADDGMSLPLYRSYFAFSPDSIASEASIRADIETMMDIAKRLRTASLIETYSGPAILSGEAAGVFFHEIFGHRIEGHRQKDVNSSQTFKNLVGEKILPEFIDVVFDPALKWLGGQMLAGSYKYDDEGVAAQRVVAVKSGIFREFLMSRSPIEKFPHSNGHGRKQANFAPVARQSNLVVQASKTVPLDTLRALMRRECQKQGKEFGLLFSEIQGGFTFTNRTIPNAFNVLPLVVYKVFADGRPDEMVRGVDLIGTPLTTFKNIVAAANDVGVFNGICGAESGGVPVSASSPSLFVSLIEAQKKAKSQAKLPILPSPVQGSSN